MGFAAVMELTGCNAHLVKMLTDPLLKVRPILIPGAMLVTYFINIALSSAAGLHGRRRRGSDSGHDGGRYPSRHGGGGGLRRHLGVHLEPGLAHPAMMAKIANVSVIEVILAHMTCLYPSPPSSWPSFSSRRASCSSRTRTGPRRRPAPTWPRSPTAKRADAREGQLS